MINEKEEIESLPTEKEFKVLQAAKWYWPEVGGIETVAVAITDAVKDKADVKVLVCSGGREKEEGVNEDGVYVYRAKVVHKIWSTPLSLDYLRAFRRMAKDVDLLQLHAPFPLSDLGLFFSRKRRKMKKALWYHCDVVKQKKLMFFYRPLLKWMLKKVDKIYVASKAIAEQSEYLSDYMDKVEVIPFGISTKEYRKAKKYPILTEKLNDKNNVKILFVGRLVYYKGIDVLIEAMAKVDGAELFVCGGGELDDVLKKRVKELGMEDKVHFMGRIPQNDLYAALSDCDFFVLPSVNKAEAFALVQLEAMVYGKPVINTWLPTAVPEVSLHGETGLTVEPGNVDQLADAMNTLVNDKELREKLGAQAKKRCETEYSLKRMQTKLYESYLDLIGKNKSEK
jgi:rhamnosyl/mannosyltransferase